MTFGFLSGSRNFCKLLWVSLVKFWFCTGTVIVSRFEIVTEDLVICCYQVTKIFSTRYGSAIASSAWSPCNFGTLTDLAISVFREMSINTVFTQIHTSHRFQRWFMRRTRVWISAFRNSVIHKILSEFLQRFWYVVIRASPYLFVILIFIWFWDFGWFM